MSLDFFRYPIEYITIKMFTTFLVVTKQLSEQTSILCPDYSTIAVVHGLYHLGSRAPSLALVCLSRVLLSTRSLFATNALQESTVRNAACANPVHEVDRERIVFSQILKPWLGLTRTPSSDPSRYSCVCKFCR